MALAESGKKALMMTKPATGHKIKMERLHPFRKGESLHNSKRRSEA
jgi:hypothetical protein